MARSTADWVEQLYRPNSQNINPFRDTNSTILKLRGPHRISLFPTMSQRGAGLAPYPMAYRYRSHSRVVVKALASATH